jgi:hypothetical protein
MAIWFVIAGLIIAGSVVLSQYAHRRVQRGDWQFAPLVFAEHLLIYGVVVAAGLRMSFDRPIVGIPLTLGALVLLGMYVRAGINIARGVRAGKTSDEVAGEILENAIEPMALYGVLVLVFGFLAVIGLIVFGVADRL